MFQITFERTYDQYGNHNANGYRAVVTQITPARKILDIAEAVSLDELNAWIERQGYGAYEIIAYAPSAEIREMAQALIDEGHDKEDFLEMGECADSWDGKEIEAFNVACQMLGYDR